MPRLSQLSTKCLQRRPFQLDVLNPRSHSRVLWLLAQGNPIDELGDHAYYRGDNFADAIAAYVDFYPLKMEENVWGKLIVGPELKRLLKLVDDIIEAEDAHISESMP